MTSREREMIRQAGAEDGRNSRAWHGLPEHIEDPATVARLAALLRDLPAPQPQAGEHDEDTPPAAA